MLSTAPQPRHAATIVLLRALADGIEVLMTRRHENLAFMGGLWVFPGGTLRPADAAAASLARLADRTDATRLCLHSLQGEQLPSETCIGLAIAACRETFEETGLLPAVDTGGRPCTATALRRLQSERAAVAAEPERFTQLLEREQLFLDVRQLVYWAHWITPSNSQRRFDTRFFALPVDADRPVAADNTETSECRWMTPAAVIAGVRSGDMLLAQPTLYTLLDLQAAYERHGSLGALLRGEVSRTVPAILPKMLDEGAFNTVIMPWDEQYSSTAGESAPPNTHYPDLFLAQPSRLTVRLRARTATAD